MSSSAVGEADDKNKDGVFMAKLTCVTGARNRITPEAKQQLVLTPEKSKS